jgi:hypothetical protein
MCVDGERLVGFEGAKDIAGNEVVDVSDAIRD